ncbi:hypothetical protein BD324DRAFT_637171 [Kockovaella imperatae]|uniref:FAD/NAD(P)-binding domain-containing protein n=1 Tax=Kockovaella imperatae TaxID=4999 RepID=A0A1Y1UAX4_9TREE|nr:hypothetical protein BD324DRAFT_637171 [Kockovaella imperatae]ORX34225.1 hypothetical protein BD324DRAFT_637171 [Kockovaella imperatae]
MSECQNIVIVGASGAGSQLATSLLPQLPRTHRILLIDASSFASWPLASLRAAVTPGWEKRVAVPLSTESIFPSGSQHQVISGCKVVELRKNSIVLERAFEGSSEVPFLKCVLATGASQGFPMRPEPGMSMEAYTQKLQQLQSEAQRATKAVIIGGGAVGLEMAGELKDAGVKSITIVHNASHVLNPSSAPASTTNDHFSYNNPPTALKLSVSLEKQLKALGIDVILDDRVVIPSPSDAGPGEWDGSTGLQNGLKKLKTKNGKVLEADYVFQSIGNKPNVGLVQSVDPGAIVSGLVAVNEYLQVISKTSQSPLTDNYFAIGDCCSTPGWKTLQGAQSDADACAVNVINAIKGKSLKAYSRGGPAAMFIPLGKSAGAGTLDLPIFGTWLVPQFMVKSLKAQKLMVEEMFMPRFKLGSQKPTVPAPPA